MNVIHKISGEYIKQVYEWEFEINDRGNVILRCNGASVFIVYANGGYLFLDDKLMELGLEKRQISYE